MPDDEVVRRVRAGAFAAYGILVGRHRPRVGRVVRAILRGDADVDDVVQQTFLQAFLALGRFTGASPLSTWLVCIARNESLLRLRRRWVVVDATSGSQVAAAPGPGPEQQAADRELLDVVRRAAQRLPPAHRELFRLRYVEGLTVVEAAARLGITEAAAKLRLHRSRTVLRGVVGSAGGFPRRHPGTGPR